MDIFKTPSQMHEWAKNKKRELKTICFVPTMGYLHQGHISLMEKGMALCDELVVSIFVNPTQFAPNEDLDAYPSNIERDLDLAQNVGVTAVFLPDKQSIYPENFQTQINLLSLSEFLCGKNRPIHFGGVAVVVTKLFNIVMPDVAVFGQKDYQQLQIIRQLVLDLNFDIKIVAGDIVREKDGLAMSSRNAYLSKPQRKAAICLFQSLNMAHAMIKQGVNEPEVIKSEMKKLIATFSDISKISIQYINFCDPITLEDVNIIEEQTLIAMAVQVGSIRLIDNILIKSNIEQKSVMGSHRSVLVPYS